LDFLSQKAARLAARSHVEGFNPMLELDIEHEGNDLNASVYGLVNSAAPARLDFSSLTFVIYVFIFHFNSLYLFLIA
jgi:hypothetical protein